MANPDIPAALVVLQAHLVAAGAALTDKLLDVDRGFPATRGRQIRYYWGGEVDPPSMPSRDLTGDIIGQRIIITALWPLSDLSEALVTAIDTEMQLLAGEIRTRILGDSQLGGNVTDLILANAQPDVGVIAGARHVILEWDLDLSYVEYAIAQ